GPTAVNQLRRVRCRRRRDGGDHRRLAAVGGHAHHALVEHAKDEVIAAPDQPLRRSLERTDGKRGSTRDRRFSQRPIAEREKCDPLTVRRERWTPCAERRERPGIQLVQVAELQAAKRRVREPGAVRRQRKRPSWNADERIAGNLERESNDRRRRWPAPDPRDARADGREDECRDDNWDRATP